LQSVWVTGENLISGSRVFKLLANRSHSDLARPYDWELWGSSGR